MYRHFKIVKITQILGLCYYTFRMLHIHKIIQRNYQARKALVCNKGGIYKRTFHKHSKNSEWETSSLRSSTWNSSNFDEIKYQCVFGRFIELVSHEFDRGFECCGPRESANAIHSLNCVAKICSTILSLGREFNERGVGRKNDFVIHEMQNALRSPEKQRAISRKSKSRGSVSACI